MTNALVIKIKDVSPSERLQWIKRGLLAAIRWHALVANSDKYNNDGENLMALVQLLEHLENNDG